MAQSLTQKWLSREAARYTHKETVYADVDESLAAYATLRPKTDNYIYDDGRVKTLLCLHGVLPIQFRGSTYNIPISCWVTLEYPKEPPIPYVVPTSDMLVKPGKFVDVSGKCEPEYLKNWERKSEGCSLRGLLESLQDLFSRNPPLYAKPRPSTPERPSSANVNPPPRPPPPVPEASSSTTAQPQSPSLPNERPRPPPKPSISYSIPGSGTDVRPESRYIFSSELTSRPPPPLPTNSPPRYVNGPSPRVGSPMRGEYHVRTPSQASSSGAPTNYGPVQRQSLPPGGISPRYATTSPPPIPPTPYGPSLQSPPPPRFSSPTNHFQAPPPPPIPPIPRGESIPVPSPHPPAPIPDLLDEDDAEISSRPTPQPAPAPPRPPNPELLRLHNQIHQKITAEFSNVTQVLAQDSERLRATQADLLAGEPAIRDEMARLEAVRDVCRTVASRTRVFIDAAEANIAEMKRKGDPEVDELVCSTTIVHNQLIELVAEDNAIEDTMYHLHRALNAGRIDLDRYVKVTRELAAEQFMKRALIKKIESAIPMGVSLGWT